jgi:acetolactate synthase-1/2/3 large subunit
LAREGSPLLGIVPRVHRGADALAQTLVQAGVKRIFTLSGNHIMVMFDAALEAGIELVHTRHEAAAVYMADAWGRLTGEPGIAMVTGGPGHANAVPALYTAQMAESPVVLLSGHAPLDEIGYGAFQELRQAEMAAPVTKASWVCASADDLGRDFARAMGIARMGRPGAVHLSLPTDVLEAQTDQASIPDAGAFLPQRMPLAEADAGAMLARLAKAKRPLVLVGPACLTRAGRARMHALEEAAGIPVVGMENARGTSDASLGAFADMLAQADCILLVGKRLDFALRFGRAPAVAAACEFMHIDAEADELERSRRAVDGRLVSIASADALSALRALTYAARSLSRARGAWCDEVRAAIHDRPAAWDHAASRQPGKLHPLEACKPLRALLDSHPDAVMVCDGGEFSQWAQASLAAPNRVINGPAGAIGGALPMALAARIAKPDAPVIAVVGDGGFGFHAAETIPRCAIGCRSSL